MISPNGNEETTVTEWALKLCHSLRRASTTA
jgi:hypothetical protein